MPYEYLEEIGTADIAFEATGRDLAELFRDAADATTSVMIDNIEAIQPLETREIELSNEKLDMLLFDFLQELIFLKDAERLLLRIREVHVAEKDENYFVKATAEGEPLDAERHHQRADVKAVTLHDFSVERWKAAGRRECFWIFEIDMQESCRRHIQGTGSSPRRPDRVTADRSAPCLLASSAT